MPTNQPSARTETVGQSNQIKASLVSKAGKSCFELTHRGESVLLTESSSLNRWAAIGIVVRHDLSIVPEGINLDGHKINFSDADAIAKLERLLNRPESRTQPPPSKAPSHAPPPKPSAESLGIGDSIKVTRDGFEFHVSFRTRFGETKHEKLERALEIFQDMRVFEPHISLQKSGIRLVVTQWDGESFLEQPGIQNVEHATPQQVEALIKSHLAGVVHRSDSSAPNIPPEARPKITRLTLLRKAHETRFHVAYHREDGTTEEGPLLVRPNMAQLCTSCLFRPGISVSMSILNDHIVIESCEREHPGGEKRVQYLPLKCDSDAKAAEEALNECLSSRPAQTPRIDSFPAAKPPHVEVIPPKAEETPISPASPQVKPTVASPEWLRNLLANSDKRPAAEINAGIFAAFERRFAQASFENDHGFPALTVELGKRGESLEAVELVLAPHYLLCTFSLGYIRFGDETRLFLDQIGEYVAYRDHALRGVAGGSAPGDMTFIVSPKFWAFLEHNSARAYKTAFGKFLESMDQIGPEREILWPLTPEDRLFQLVSATARGYGLPVSAEGVVLNQTAAEFVGFRSVAPHGIEFRNGDDFIRFSPMGVEVCDKGSHQSFDSTAVIRGWALDGDGRVCALYRKESGFVPPVENSLVCFLPEEERENVLLTELGFLSEEKG